MADSCLTKAKAALAAGNFDEALENANKAEDLARKDGAIGLQVSAMTVATSAYTSKGEYNIASLKASDALNVASTSKDKKVEAEALLGQAKAMLALYEGWEASESAEKAVAIYKELKEKKLEADASKVLADAYICVGDPEGKALAVAKLAYSIYKKIPDMEAAGLSLKTVKDALMAQSQVGEAQRFIKQELKIFQNTGESKAEGVASGVYIEVLVQKGSMDAAEKACRSAIDRMSEMKDMKKEEAKLQYLLAEILAKQSGNTKAGLADALEAAIASASAANAAGDKEGVLMAKQYQTSLYSSLGEDPPSSDDRDTALEVLQEIKSSIEKQDAAGYIKSKAMLSETCGVTDMDVTNVLGEVMSSTESQSFLAGVDDEGKDQTAATAKNQKVYTPGCVWEHFSHEAIYMGFRFGGLGYGPRFQCQKLSGYKGEGYDKKACCVIRQDSDCENWECECRLVPPLYDGALHASATFGYPSKRFEAMLPSDEK